MREDGSLIGYKAKQEAGPVSDPLNNFTVRGCQVLKTERPKPFTFMLRGLQWTTVIERTFCTDSDKDRDEWCKAIEHVSGLLNTIDEQDVEMTDLRAHEAEMSRRLHIGTKNSTSRGGRKIVRNVLVQLNHFTNRIELNLFGRHWTTSSS